MYQASIKISEIKNLGELIDKLNTCQDTDKLYFLIRINQIKSLSDIIKNGKDLIQLIGCFSEQDLVSDNSCAFTFVSQVLGKEQLNKILGNDEGTKSKMFDIFLNENQQMLLQDFFADPTGPRSDDGCKVGFLSKF